MITKKQYSLILKAFTYIGIAILASCNGGSKLTPSKNFGAYYTKIDSGEEFEKHSRTGNYADIIVDLGEENGKFVFWRGSSYLPYFETVSANKIYVDEIVPRNGDGTEIMPDRTNTYSFVRLIESNENRVVVHWRYLPEFTGGNPQLGVSADKFVDEYFYIQSDGTVRRTIKKGTKRIDDWRDEKNCSVQSFLLSKDGIKNIKFTEASKSGIIDKVVGNPAITETVVEPVAWWKFDEAGGDLTTESVGDNSLEVDGSKTLWRKGVSGTALQFDGYYSKISLPAANSPKIKGAVTFETWLSIGAYPWSTVPIVQQADDVPEELLAKKGGESFLIGEEGRDDFKESLEKGEEVEQFGFIMKKEDDRGYFFGIDGYGNPTFKLRVGGVWEELVTNQHLERRTWYHLAANYDKTTGLMKVFVDGKKVREKAVAKSDVELSDNDLQIGQGKIRRPVDPVRDNTFPGSYSLDGLIDELKIYDVALTDKQISSAYQLYEKNREKITNVDMDKRVLPDGENRKQFGAYYTHLNFYDAWDNLWRFSEHPDVVVEFDNIPSKFIFWRGVGYIPMMVNDKGQWYSNEFNETWNKTGGEGCQEPMSDKESYTNHVRIIENTPARTVVHWRYPLIDVKHVMANFIDETGWCDWSDWYYYIYPDGVAVKTMHLWTSGERNHEWQESMAIFGPDQHPEEIIHTKETLSMLNLKGEKVVYDWIGTPPDNIEKPEEKCIQVINYTGVYKPVTIGSFLEGDVYSGELTEYAAFPTWNHWPVSQMPSDGRYASFSDRTSHSSLTHVPPTTYKEVKDGNTPYQQKLLMEAMLNIREDEVVSLAKSWMHAPKINNLKGAKGSYDAGQRAYLLKKTEDSISLTINASNESPIVNLGFVVKNWGDKSSAKMLLDGNEMETKQGIIRDTDGTPTLILWAEIQTTQSIDVRIVSKL